MKFCLGLLTTLSVILFAACSTSPDDSSATPWRVDKSVLSLAGQAVLTGLPEGVSVSGERNSEQGAFLMLRTGESRNGYYRWTGMHLAELERLTALYREQPWWMVPRFGKSESDLPLEVQFLLWRRADGRVGLILPLLDQGFRVNAGGDSGALMLTADNNMPSLESGLELRGAYVAVGDDPYAMLDEAFDTAVRAMGVGRLRREKTLPRWIDRLGWCTWNSFYHAVTEKGVLDGLESFARGGLRPGWLILDDGWQQAREYGFLDKETYLTGLHENREKFPDGLAALVKASKDKYGIEDFLVWQTLQGYWRGIDTTQAGLARFRTYPVQGRSNRPLPKDFTEWATRPYQAPAPGAAAEFFEAYHEWMATQGVTGVKVDNQSNLEFMTWGAGPLAEVMGEYKRALESSVERHFGAGSLINCMGQGSDALFQATSSTVTRNSDDYFPDIPGSHGVHLVTNAYNSLMTAQLVHPDWDMFQSGHEWGAFHASARAVSGSPVYLSDRPGQQDFDLLRRISLPDGRVLRCPEPGLPTPDILFRDPLHEDVALRIYNHNLPGAWILGVWNCRWDSLRAIEISDTLGVSLIPGTDPAQKYAVRAYNSGRLDLRGQSELWTLNLGQKGFEVYTIVAIDRGIAPLGAIDMYNSAGIFDSYGWSEAGTFKAALKAGGRIAFYCEKKPAALKDGQSEIPFDYDSGSGLLVVQAPGLEPLEVEISF